jgi:hypothetical protein
MEGEKVRTVQYRFQNLHSRFVGFIMRHPVGVVIAAVLGAVFALLYTATHLAFDSNRLDLVSAGEHYTQEDATRQQMLEVRRLVTQFDETTARMGDAEARQALSAFQSELMQDLREKLDPLKANVRRSR